MAMKKNKPILLLSSIFIIAILASACGGGDSGPNVNGGNNPPTSGDLNPGLSGKLFFKTGYKGTIVSDGEEFSAWTMDIATGKYARIPNTDWADHGDRFPGNWFICFVAPAGYDGTEFTVEIPDCKNYPDRTCIAIQDMDGNYLGQFEISGDEYSFAKMSQDHQNIALANRKGFDSWLEIYDRNGTFLSSSKLKSRFIRELDWLPNGRIIYGIQRSFYFTAPYSTQAENILTLPNDLQGEKIGEIAVSPDGARLAFTVDGVPYIANIDGTLIRKLAVLTYAEADIDNIAWSPDAQWILLGTKEVYVVGGPGGLIRRHNYVIPSEDLGKVFTLSEDDDLRSPEVRLLLRHKDIKENTDSTVTDVGLVDVAWLS